MNEIIQSEELKERLFHVHLKDCNARKENVISGEGKVNFESIFKNLYEGLLCRSCKWSTSCRRIEV